MVDTFLGPMEDYLITFNTVCVCVGGGVCGWVGGCVFVFTLICMHTENVVEITQLLIYKLHVPYSVCTLHVPETSKHSIHSSDHIKGNIIPDTGLTLLS